MSEPIKLQQDELKQLEEIQNRYQEKIFKFGQLYIEKLELDSQIKKIADAENTALEELAKVREDERIWFDNIAIKYGDGNLSLKNGTFIPK